MIYIFAQHYDMIVPKSMNITDFYSVLDYIEKAINELGIISLYSELSTSLSQTQQNPDTANFEIYLSKKEATLTALTRMEPTDWDYAKTNIYKNFSQNGLVGVKAANRLNKIFSDNEANPAGAMTQISTLSNETINLLQTISTLKTGLHPLVAKSNRPEDENKRTIQIVFDKDVSIDTFEDMEKYANDWKQVLNGLSRLTKDNQPPEIVYIQKSSPVIVCVAATINRLLAMFEASAEG